MMYLFMIPKYIMCIMCIKVIIQIAINKVLSLVHTVPDFSPGVATVWTPGPTGTKQRIESGYIMLNRCSPGSGPGGFIFLTTVTHRDAKQRRLIPGHHCRSSGTNRISTVRPPGKTVANRHELCLRWPRCVTEKSRRIPDFFRSNYGLARYQPLNAGKGTVELRYDYGSSRWTPIDLQKQYLLNNVYLF